MRALCGMDKALRVNGNDFDTPDGTAIRDYIHVADLASAHAKALEYLENGGESTVLNLGTGRGQSIAEIISAARSVTRKDFPVIYGPRREGDPAISVADAGKARSLLRWTPDYEDISHAIQHCWRWLQLEDNKKAQAS
jgi:UDP-glucose 4-epimerase